MAIQLGTAADGTSLQTLQRFNEYTQKPGYQMVAYNNLNQTGVVLSSAKTYVVGLMYPANRQRGSVRGKWLLQMPLANAADGTPRSIDMIADFKIPVDATETEKAIFANNVYQGGGATELWDALKFFKLSV